MRHALLALLAALAIMVSACDTDGELRIRNRTAAEIYISVDDAAPHTIPSWANWSKYYPKDETATITYSGNYVFANTITREVRQNLVTTVDIEPDGGAFSLRNDGSQALTEVYISPTGEPNWGDNDLSNNLAPGDSTLWTVTEGSWDLRVVASNLTTYFKYNQPIVKNSTTYLDLSDFDSKESRRQESMLNNRNSQRRTEQQR